MPNETLRIYAGLGFVKLCLLALVVAVLLAGCAAEPTPDKIAGPPKYLMTAPNKFPTLKEGDDAAQKLAEAAEVHNRNARKIRGLQQYIRVVRKEQ